MALANTKSISITNADASPRVPNDSWFDGGQTVRFSDFVTALAADSINSVYRVVRLRSGDKVSALSMSSDTQNTLGVASISLYNTAANGGAVVAGTPGGAGIFATSIDVHTAAFYGVSYLFNVTTLDKINKRIWELLGLSVDPYTEYDLCIVMTTAGTAGGKMALDVSIVR